MMGSGLLAIWSDIDPAQETDYLHWLTREHTAERVGIPGFEGVRVFRADLADACRYLILYDLAAPAVLTSPDYLRRLNDPTPWSRRIMPTLRHFARGGGEVLAEAGQGRGAHLLALRLGRRPVGGGALLEAIGAEDRVCAARLLDVDAAGTAVRTDEKALRGSDESFPGLLLVEALDSASLRGVLSRHGGGIGAIGVQETTPVTYTAVFTLRRAELPAAGRA